MEMHMADETKFFKYDKRENLILCSQVPDCTSLQPSLKKYIVKMMLMMNDASLQWMMCFHHQAVTKIDLKAG